MIKQFDSSYAGHIDMENCGYLGTPVNSRRYSNAQLITAHTKAEEQAKRTLRIKPDYAAAHLLLGLIYREQRNDEMARLHFSQAIQYAPDAPFAARARQWLESTQPPSGGRGGR